VLFEHDRGEQRRLETVRTAVPDDPAEAPESRATARLLVVRQLVEISLDGSRRGKLRDQPQLAAGELGRGANP